MDDEDMGVNVFYLDKTLGFKMAHFSWLKCKVVKDKRKVLRNHYNLISYMKKHIAKSQSLLNVIYSDDEMKIIIETGQKFKNETFNDTIFRLK